MQSGAHAWRTYAASLIRLAQMLTFVLTSSAGFHWTASTIGPVKLVLGLTAISGYTQWFDFQTYVALYYFAVVWVVVFLGLFVWSALSLMTGSVTALWPLYLLRGIGSFSASGAFIPIFTREYTAPCLVVRAFERLHSRAIVQRVDASPALACVYSYVMLYAMRVHTLQLAAASSSSSSSSSPRDPCSFRSPLGPLRPFIYPPSCLLAVLMSGFVCDSTPAERSDAEGPSEWWGEAGIQCFVGGHVAQVVITAILTIAFVLLCLLFAWLVYDGNPLSVSVAAKATARTEAAFLGMKVRAERRVVLILAIRRPRNLRACEQQSRRARVPS